MSEEKKLINQILAMYDVLGTNGRPVRNISTPVTVEFGLGLIQMDLDEKYKVLKMSMWSRYVRTLHDNISCVVIDSFIQFKRSQAHGTYIV